MDPLDALVTYTLDLVMGGSAIYLGASLTLYLVKRWQMLEVKPKGTPVKIPLTLKESAATAIPLEAQFETTQALVLPVSPPQPAPIFEFPDSELPAFEDSSAFEDSNATESASPLETPGLESAAASPAPLQLSRSNPTTPDLEITDPATADPAMPPADLLEIAATTAIESEVPISEPPPLPELAELAEPAPEPAETTSPKSSIAEPSTADLPPEALG